MTGLIMSALMILAGNVTAKTPARRREKFRRRRPDLRPRLDLRRRFDLFGGDVSDTRLSRCRRQVTMVVRTGHEL